MRIDEERAFGAALRNAEEFFMGEARVQKALEEVTAAFSPCQPEGWHFGDLGHPKLPVLWFDRLHIPFAVAGAMALNAYGYERVTTDVDLLVTREGLASFKAACLGRGYSEKLPGSKGVRDTVHGVDIDFLLAGEYPGDGKQKPVAFPDPATVATVSAKLAARPDAPIARSQRPTGGGLP